MATGHSTQLTRQIGEHLVAAKLGRLGLFATPFAGNVPEFDLIVADGKGKSVLVQVKAIYTSWQFDADKFLEINLVGDEQIVMGKKNLTQNIVPSGQNNLLIIKITGSLYVSRSVN